MHVNVRYTWTFTPRHVSLHVNACFPVFTHSCLLPWKQYKKEYATAEEYNRRLKIFADNALFVSEFNGQGHSYEREASCIHHEVEL